MHQFFTGNDAAYADLERRCRAACVVFSDQAMPPGAQPPRARIGFETDPCDGSVCLLVDHGVTYHGSHTAVREWLQTGAKQFASFQQLRSWIQEVLQPAYVSEDGYNLPQARPQREISRQPHELTDLAAVQEEAHDPHAPLYLDEDALYNELSRRVRGQEQALRLLAGRVCRHIARTAPRRPSTLFLIGPTGVGKTTAAEALAPTLRSLDPDGAGYSFLRLDMSEYQERHRISQLLGAPQGYVGYGEGAQLVDALSANPRTIVLFDEIEKAHRDILRTLMNAMDAGRLSTPSASAHGREVDCRRAIFLFTSNLDPTGILQDLEARGAFDVPGITDEVCRSRLRAAGMAPELIGRISCFLVFRPLMRAARAEIAALAVARVAEEYGLNVRRIEPSVIVQVLDRSRSDGFGARPDEYAVDELLGSTFAEAAVAYANAEVEVHGGPPYRCVPVHSSELNMFEQGMGK